MKINYEIETAIGKMTASFEGETQKALFGQLGDFLAVFGTHRCGQCGSENSIPVHRVIGKHHYYSKVCQEPKCGAQLSFGQNLEGGSLFAKHKVDGVFDKEHKGWGFYKIETPEDENEDEDTPQPKVVQKNTGGFRPKNK